MSTISLDDPSNFAALLEILSLPVESGPRLKEILQAGVPHQVLNAAPAYEESQIIAGAGAFGAVTIATNMAGRGVDIKLGGEIAEEVISAVNRVLRRAGYEDPFDMPLEERRQALLKVDPGQYGLYEGEVRLFLQYFEDMERVKQLGGLHVIGSERHEARRIDNQLRGRSGRQGDPGSSRFYLSLEDELMRLFGGDQVSGLMQRLKVDELCRSKLAWSVASSRTLSTASRAPTLTFASTCWNTTTCSISSASRSIPSVTASS